MDIKNYLSGKVDYYVDDFFPNGMEKVEYLFVLESPHVEEIKKENLRPLSGRSGAAVLKFLFDDAGNYNSFAEKIESDKDLNIGIVNISNVPLQNIESINKSDNVKAKLDMIRNSDDVDVVLYDLFKQKMDKYRFPKIKKYIICGEFASIYFEKYKEDANDKKITDNILKVPHPSRGQWGFVEKHANNLTELKKIFKKLEAPNKDKT